MTKTWIGLALSLGLCACSSGTSSGLSTNGGPGAPGGGGFTPAGPGGDTSSGSSGSSSGGGFGGGSSSGSAGAPVGAFAGGGASAGTSTGTTAGTMAAASDAGPVQQVGTGILTAGIWDDSLNYDFFGHYLASHAQIPGAPGFAMADYDAAHTEFARRTARSVVDVALVMDTTGSMGDEIAYLTAEFAGISSSIGAAFPNADQRWALVVYRDTPDTDQGDEYVVRSFDFTTSAQTFAATVGAQSAGGGGDYPESPELGLEQLTQLAWRSDPSVAKLAFWIGDAPHHDYRAAAMKKAIVDVHAAGIHLYPVSASGTDDLLELTMRSAAEITGGRYLFLTNDSGVGDPHKVPEIPCYFVTRLEKAIVRVVGMELSGTYVGPDTADVLRVSGNASTGGACSIGDGGTVQIF